MGFIEILLVGVALSMDAFAVSVCKGLGMKKLNGKQALIIGLFFGGFQALMPLIGWALGSLFSDLISSVDHWIAFGLLAFIGGKMLWDVFHGEGEGEGEDEGEGQCACAEQREGGEASATLSATVSSADKKFSYKELFMLAIATSIDALATGIAFAALQVNIWIAILIIGVTTFVLSLVGVVIGHQFGSRYEKPATIVGGVVLILLGVKILLEHLGILVL